MNSSASDCCMTTPDVATAAPSVIQETSSSLKVSMKLLPTEPCPVCERDAWWVGQGEYRTLTCGSCHRSLSPTLVTRIRAVLRRTRIDTVSIPGTIPPMMEV